MFFTKQLNKVISSRKIYEVELVHDFEVDPLETKTNLIVHPPPPPLEFP